MFDSNAEGNHFGRCGQCGDVTPGAPLAEVREISSNTKVVGFARDQVRDGNVGLLTRSFVKIDTS